MADNNKLVTIKPLQTLWRRLTAGFVQTVPEDIAVCEFDCGKANCTAAEWRNCKRRLHGIARTIKRAA